MADLSAARAQMAISLGFHIVFASIGIAMPFLMAISHWQWLKTKQQAYPFLPGSHRAGDVSTTGVTFTRGRIGPGIVVGANHVAIGILLAVVGAWSLFAFWKKPTCGHRVRGADFDSDSFRACAHC